jgi:vancomycin resistance protein YoaR
MLRIRDRGTRVAVSLDARLASAAAVPLLERFRRTPVSARFELAAGRVRVVPGVTGYAPDRAGAARAVAAAALSSSRTAELPLRALAPELTTGEAHALGIRERVSSFTTDMGVSSANRVHNVQLMADTIDGTVIRPGEEFSFNETVGPRTVERGFREGQMIVGSLLLPSIGGGVCQTATTLFNNAFELGLPMVERHNHSFYISHYPLGRDATVAWGGPDFRFRNDLRTGLLVKASYTDETLTFTFYGTPSRRRVVSETGPRTNWRAPRMSYAYDPSAPPRSVRVVAGSNQRGFDVAVHRTVYEGGEIVRRDSFASSYIAVGPTTIFGPGRTPPGNYFVIPATE